MMDTTSADIGVANTADTDLNDALDVPQQDPALEVLVGVINALHGTEIGITLHASGLVVSGMLISGRRYFELLIESLENSPSEGGGTFGQLFTPFRDRYTEDGLTNDSTEGEDTTLQPVGFIHMRDAQTFSPTGHSLPGTLWRARLTEITGWSIGSYGRTPPTSEQ